jgi:hypothetical protein
MQIVPIEPVEPVRPFVLDYAAATGLPRFHAPIAVRLLLLLGAVATFVPFTSLSHVSPLDTTVYLLQTGPVHRLDFLVGAVGFAMEMALPFRAGMGLLANAGKPGPGALSNDQSRQGWRSRPFGATRHGGRHIPTYALRLKARF